MRSLALLAAVVLGLCALPAGAASLAQGVSSGSLRGGGSYIVRPQAGAPVAAVELWFRAPSVGFARDPIPGLALYAAKSVAASTPITGTSVSRFVTDMGGKIAISAYPDSLEVSALVPADRASEVVRAMTASFFAPVLTQQGMRTARGDMAQEELIRSFDSDEVLRDALLEELFTGGPAHYSRYGQPQDLRKVTLDTLHDFALRAFRAKNALLVVTGAVDNAIAGRAVEGRPRLRGDNGETPAPSVLAQTPATAARDFTDRAFGYAFAGPPITDERAATAMDFISDYLFRPQTGVVSRELSRSNVSVAGQFVTYHNPGVMLVQSSGSGDLKAARATIDKALAAMRSPLEKKTFEAAREAFVYHLLSDLQTPLELADNFGWYSIEGNAAYAPGLAGDGGRYFGTARGLTAQFVASIAAKYLSSPGATVTLGPATAPRPQATP